MKTARAHRVFLENLGSNNPVFVQILGICSTLAVTNFLKNTLVMCAGLVFTTALSNLTVSAMRKAIPSSIRMMVQVLVIACYVLVVDILLRACMPEMSRQLGPYVGLIITNCIVMGRTEAFALGNPPMLSLVDGISAGLGYSYVLIAIAVIRELMGSGTLLGRRILGHWWVNWSIMTMAPGAFFVLALLIWLIKSRISKAAQCCGGEKTP